MPTKPWDIDPEENELNLLRQECAKLRAQRQELQEKLDQKAQTKQEKPEKSEKRSSIFLIVAALIVAARLVIFIVVEQWGAQAKGLDFSISVGAIFFGVVAVIHWMGADYEEEGIILGGRVVFLAVQTLIAISILNPKIMSDADAGPPVHPVLASVFLIASLLLAATRLCFVIMRWLLKLVSYVPKRRDF
jgi:hypothetical protein